MSENTPFLSNGPNLATDHDNWKPGKNFRWIQLATMFNVFLMGFDQTIAASTYAVIGSEFQSMNQVSWISTSYLITSTAFQPLYGRTSDILGRRFCYLASTTIFFVGCFLCGLARSMLTLNLARALTGIGGGGLLTMSTVILSDLIPFHKRGIYQAMNNLTMGVGATLGASLGGIIADNFGWRWAFFLQLPFAVFGILVGFLFISSPHPSTHGSGLRQIDYLGSSLLVVGLAIQLTGTNLGGNELPWGSPVVVGCLVISGVILAGFLYVEGWVAEQPVLPLSVLTEAASITNNLFTAGACTAIVFMLPLFFQAVLSESASKAGLRLVPLAIALPIGGLVSGVVMSKWGHLGTLVRIGSVILFCGCYLISTLDDQSPQWKLYTFLLPTTFGQGLVYPSSLFAMLAKFEHSQQAVTTSAVYLFRNLGSVWAIAAVSSLLQTLLSIKLPVALEGIPGKNEIIEGVRHSVEYIKTIENDDVRRRVLSVFVFGIQSTLLLSAVLAGIAMVGGMFVTGEGLTRTRVLEELDEEEIGEEDFAETIARVVERRLSVMSR